MIDPRRLIVNADDFGLTPGINRGILRAHADGIVTSTSLMVRGPAAREAVEAAKSCPALSIGLHLDLCEWEYRDGEWRILYSVVDTADAVAVAREVERQLALFRGFVGRDPTHLDSHQHVHRHEPVLSLARAAARAMGIVLRDDDARVRYRGDFYGQSNRGEPCHEQLSVESLVRTIASLGTGITEMGCHPGEGDDVESVYKSERSIEVTTLCDPRVRDAIVAGGIELSSFEDVRGAE